MRQKASHVAVIMGLTGLLAGAQTLATPAFAQIDGVASGGESVAMLASPTRQPAEMERGVPSAFVITDETEVIREAPRRRTGNERDPAAIAQTANRVGYQLLIQDMDRGVLQAYSTPYGTFVPLKDLLHRLGLSYTTDDADQSLRVVFADKKTLVLNFKRGEYIRNGVVESLRANDFIASGADFFLNYEFLNGVLPVGLSVNQAAQKISVIQKGCNGGQSCPVISAADPVDVLIQNAKKPAPVRDPSDSLTLSATSSQMSMVVDDVASQETAAADKQKERIQYVPSQAQIAAEQASKDEADIARNEDGSLILQPRLKRNDPSNLLIEALEKDGKLYLPLADMVKLLEFNIKVDGARGEAKGTSIDDKNSFYLDAKNRVLHLGGVNVPVAAQDVLLKGNRLYVSSDAFNRWFNVNPAFDRQMMTLQLDTGLTLPSEAREARHAMWKKLMDSANQDGANYEVRENPYALAAVPFVDVNIGSMAQMGGKGDNSSFVTNYTLQSAGDLGYLTTETYLAGSSEKEAPTNLRMRAGRQDYSAGLLGPLHATAYSLGDVDSPSLDLVTTSSQGRGVMVTNRKPGAQDNFDTKTFNGDAVPGWEVELYRNNALLFFQTVNANGRYEFADVPIVYGTNIFRIVLYGPQGQVEERIETITVADRMLKPGELQYNFSANEKNASLVDLDDTSVNSQVVNTNPTGLRTVAETRVGLTDFLTMGVGAATTRLQDGQHEYANVSLATNFAGVFTEANLIKDINSGWAGSLTALTSIEDVSLRIRHRLFSHFFSEVENNFLDPRESETNIDGNTQLFLPLIQDIGVGAEIKYETFSLHGPRTTITNRLSKSLWGVGTTNNISYVEDDTTKQIQGTFGMQSRIGGVLGRVTGNYALQPEMVFNNISVVGEYRLDKDLSARTQFDQGLGLTTESTVTQTVNWDLDDYRLSFSTSADSESHVIAGVNLTFSFGRDGVNNRWKTQSTAMSSGGAVTGRVYRDDNYNGVFDANEQLVPDAAVRTNRMSHKTEEGQVFLAPVTPYEAVKVDVDAATVHDPMLGPSVPGYKIITRPGDTMALDFPLVATSEIDGTVRLVDDAGNYYQIPDIVVELQDSNRKTLRRVISEYDGFYIFDKIRAGDYYVTIPPEALQEYGARLISPVRLKIDKASEVYNDKNLILHIKGPVPEKLRIHREKTGEEE
jgi:hypothetical protein